MKKYRIRKHVTRGVTAVYFTVQRRCLGFMWTTESAYNPVIQGHYNRVFGSIDSAEEAIQQLRQQDLPEKISVVKEMP